ncbi:MAG TPA: elongation factor P [Armatimonadota bacterium]|nr:elongation factor P [Armatimonadota bacterium]
MASTADFKNGLTIELDGDVYQIIEFQHVKPGKGGAFVRTRIRKMSTGQVIDKTFRAGERVEIARVERKNMQYLYHTGEDYVFMDNETFDQITLTEDQLGPQVKFLQDNSDVMVITHDDRLLGVDLPDTIEATVVQTDPGLKGDTASGGSKPATIETGAVVTVPLFINEGDRIRVDTRSAKYIERV